MTKLGLVKYFNDLIEYNTQAVRYYYSQSHLIKLGWKDGEISEAKILALVKWLQDYIDQNKEEWNRKGLNLNKPKRFFLTLGWTQAEINEAIKRSTSSTMKKVKILLLVLLGLVIAFLMLNNWIGMVKW